MTKTEVMNQLKAMGTDQNRKVYARHGIKGRMFGVSYVNLNKLKKQIKTDHKLAEMLWNSGNHDARVLATMIADPGQMNLTKLSGWTRALDNYVLTDAFSTLVAKTTIAKKCMAKWITSEDEWLGSAGWTILTKLVMEAEQINNDECLTYLKMIEERIHSGKNRVKHSMNNALIAIGLCNASLQKQAIAAAKRIGKVEVDHGETSCKTPDAVSYIQKAIEHKRKR